MHYPETDVGPGHGRLPPATSLTMAANALTSPSTLTALVDGKRNSSVFAVKSEWTECRWPIATQMCAQWSMSVRDGSMFGAERCLQLHLTPAVQRGVQYGRRQMFDFEIICALETINQEALGEVYPLGPIDTAGTPGFRLESIRARQQGPIEERQTTPDLSTYCLVTGKERHQGGCPQN